ncbi:MAG TPA: glycosyltransferase family 39 protein, partial [Solirubrobacteraceae bacterium]|nr:glycosyltransferase family 39 protein [Solirubrobacteraceae bacterium]
QLQPEISEVIGPAAVLAAVWTVTGSERYVYGYIVQIFVDTLAVLLVYRIAMLLFGRRRAALVAAALYAVYPPIARQSSMLAPDIWGVDFTIAVVAAYVEARYSSARWRWLLACAALVGAGAYFRPNLLIMPAALGLASVPWEGWRALRDAAAVTLAACVLLIPWTVRNYVDFHRFIPTRTAFGQVLWEGLGELHNDFGALDNDEETYRQVHRTHPNLVEGTPAYDAYLRGLAAHAIEHHPLFYADLVAHRVVLSTVLLYDSAWMYRGGESLLAYRRRTGRGPLSYVVERPLELLESLLDPAVFMLAMVSLAFTWRHRRREHALLIAAGLAALIPYWILHFEARYVYPATFLYLIWIAVGADLLLARAREHSMGRRGWLPAG